MVQAAQLLAVEQDRRLVRAMGPQGGSYMLETCRLSSELVCFRGYEVGQVVLCTGGGPLAEGGGEGAAGGAGGCVLGTWSTGPGREGSRVEQRAYERLSACSWWVAGC